MRVLWGNTNAFQQTQQEPNTSSSRYATPYLLPLHLNLLHRQDDLVHRDPVLQPRGDARDRELKRVIDLGVAV